MAVVRLKKNYEVARVFSQGKRRVVGVLAVHYLPNRKTFSRLAVTTSKQLKLAVRRNRVRRLLREAYRLLEPQVKTGYDIVLMGLTYSVDLDLATVQKHLRKALSLEGLIAKEP